MTSTPVYDSAQTRTPLISELRNYFVYRGLIRLLVTRDLTVRYKRSVLGVWWTLLNPLLTSGVMYIVFGELFAGRFGSTGQEPYILYLLAGVLFMSFFSQGLLATAGSITGARSILSKVYVPPEVFGFSTATAGLVNFGLSIVPLFVIEVITGNGIPWTALLIPIPAVLMMAFVAGLGLLVASAAVFFHDVIDLTRVGVQLLTYLTPVFWPLSIVPDRFLPIVQANPMFSFLEGFRALMYRGEIPPWWQLAMMVGSAVVALAVGVSVFAKAWKTLKGQI